MTTLRERQAAAQRLLGEWVGRSPWTTEKRVARVSRAVSSIERQEDGLLVDYLPGEHIDRAMATAWEVHSISGLDVRFRFNGVTVSIVQERRS